MKAFFGVLLAILYAAFLPSCSKDSGGEPNTPSVPTLTTTTATTITATSAESGGTITSDGGSAITARGVCWSTTVPATIADAKTVNGSGIGTYTSSLTNLLPLTAYSVRAYAINGKGTGYGDPVLIVTSIGITVPTVTTNDVSIVNNSGAVTGGNVTADGHATVTARGICWSRSPNPTINDSKLSGGAGIGSFSSDITGLTVNTTYYARAYATNSIGTGYGNQITFTTAYLIGQLYQGGRIFYVDNTKLHGLITATQDQSLGAKWDNNPSGSFAAADAYSYTDGITNTNIIIAAVGTTNNAAAICGAYSIDGYTDWYLPSRDELHKLYLQKNVIGNLQNYYYWSSTANSSYIGTAWSQDFGSGFYNDNSLKTFIYTVRAIRAF